jgi:FtsZ-interacting cell division protein ZipA
MPMPLCRLFPSADLSTLSTQRQSSNFENPPLNPSLRMAYRARPQSASQSPPSFASTKQYGGGLSSTSSSSATLQRTRPGSAARTQQRSSQSQSSSSSNLTASRRRAAEQSESYERERVSANMQSALDMSKAEKERLIEALAAEQNGYLLMLLEKEQGNEVERGRILSSIDDLGDQRRLEKIFAIERAKASAVIKNVTKEHERELALKLHEMGMISEDEDDPDL